MDFTWEPKVVDTAGAGATRIEVIEYRAVPVAPAISGFRQDFLAPNPWRQLAIHTGGQVATLEPGALQYLRGNIELDAAIGSDTGSRGLGSLIRGAISAATTGESMFKTIYRGAGVIYTELTQLNILVGEIADDSLIADDGAFIACAGDMTVGRHVNHSLTQMLGSGEGRVQPKLEGTGVFALQSPVPANEFQIIELNNDTLKVDGNLILAYTGGLKFEVERSTRGLLSSATTGEGFVQVFRGSGVLWLAPTLPLYQPPPDDE